jgi:hypothetical protein
LKPLTGKTAMSISIERRDLYTRLLVASQEAMEREQYEVAYHALSAALHFAQDTRDAERLDEVANVALSQLAYINVNAPSNLMSTKSAENRRGVDMYEMLSRMAEMRAKMIRGTD